MSKYIIALFLISSAASQGYYGQSGNSQVGSNTATPAVLPPPTNPNTGGAGTTNTPPTGTTPNTHHTPVPANGQGYGQNGNSQIGSNSTPINPLTPTSATNIPSSPTSCVETDMTSTCISKPTCCHVTNSYSSYTYTVCVDVKNPQNFQQFCNNFNILNSKEGFVSNECVCFGNVKYPLHSSYLQPLTYLFFLAAYLILLF